jgi:cell division protein FtsI/penicillin-binding protein 2
MVATIASGGRVVKPNIFHTETVATATVRNDNKSIPIRQSSLAVVQSGLLMAVEDSDGTAHDSAWLPTVQIAGKTGTAQSGGDRPDHAWFAGYVPAQHPQFAFCVALEHGGEASSAAQVARQIVQRIVSLGMLLGDHATVQPR